MTIHKSKGLEFPIVIYPFADSETYRNRSTKKWLPFSEEKDSFNLLIPFSEGIKEYSSAFFDEYGLHIENQEFDNLNLLYVAFTRAEDELHVISVNPKKGSLASHSEIIRFFLEKNKKWKNNNSSYCWGEKTTKKRIKPIKNLKKRTSIFTNRFSHEINPKNYRSIFQLTFDLLTRPLLAASLR